MKEELKTTIRRSKILFPYIILVNKQVKEVCRADRIMEDKYSN